MASPRMPARSLFAILVLSFLSLPAVAQSESGSPSSSWDRLFLRFAQDATVPDRQWWEGQVAWMKAKDVDQATLRGVVDFQPWNKVGIGGRVGFANTDTTTGLPDGSGATDLDIWGKYYFGAPASAPNTEFTLGGIVTVPTGDDASGLGYDAFAITAFGGVRHRLRRVILSFTAGLQANDNGSIFESPKLDGEVAPQAGAAGIIPLGDRTSVVVELTYNGKRFEGFDDVWLALGGVNWRPFNRGMLRGALTVGLNSTPAVEVTPKYSFLISYAAMF